VPRGHLLAEIARRVRGGRAQDEVGENNRGGVSDPKRRAPRNVYVPHRPSVACALSLLLGVAAQARATPIASAPPLDNALMRAPASLRYTCQRLDARLVRARVRWRVACPTWVPDSQVLFVIGYNGGLGTNDFRAGYVIDVGGSGPLAGASGGHWVLVGGDARELHDAFLVSPNGDGKATVSTTSHSTLIAGRRVRIYFVSDAGMAFYTGHVVVEWSQKGEGWQVSIHGWQHEPQARAMAGSLIGQIARWK
jgi:hypothetical protein